jgi:hypothetical protein
MGLSVYLKWSVLGSAGVSLLVRPQRNISDPERARGALARARNDRGLITLQSKIRRPETSCPKDLPACLDHPGIAA